MKPVLTYGLGVLIGSLCFALYIYASHQHSGTNNVGVSTEENHKYIRIGALNTSTERIVITDSSFKSSTLKDANPSRIAAIPKVSVQNTASDVAPTKVKSIPAQSDDEISNKQDGFIKRSVDQLSKFIKIVPEDTDRSLATSEASQGHGGKHTKANKGDLVHLKHQDLLSKTFSDVDCKAMQSTYDVVPGISWGTLPLEYQRYVYD